MTQTDIKTNSFKAWFIAFRLYSISGAAVPVAIGMALAWTDLSDKSQFSWLVLVLSFLFAFIMQIDSNIINDYFDCLRGNDDDTYRMGPKRACTQGWVTMPAMKRMIIAVTTLGALVGLSLAWIGGWQMIIVGVMCIAGAFLYTTHLSYKGMSDVLCLLFFGLVPVCIPYYIQTHTMTVACFSVGLSAGIVIDAMMMANNYRDIPNDIRSGKRTLFVMMGAKAARICYAAVGPVALWLNIPLAMDGHLWALLLPAITYLPMHCLATKRIYEIREGKELNRVLTFSAKNILVYGIATVIGILC